MNNTPTAHELRQAAKHLRNLYQELNNRKTEKPYTPRLERKMIPTFKSTTPGNTELISLEIELLSPRKPTTNPQLPTGLKPAATQAKQHTSRRNLPLLSTGTYICTFIESTAEEITEKAPNNHELYNLMNQQIAYLTKKIADTNPAIKLMQQKNIKPETAWATASQLAPIASQYTGKNITKDQIRKWASRGHIEKQENPAGQTTYNLGQIIKFSTKNH